MQAPYTEEMTTQAPNTHEMPTQAPEQVDEVQMAKEALGLDAYEQQLQAMQAQLAESNNKAMLNEVSSQYEGVPVEEVEKALTAMAETNPQMAEMMKSDKNGLDMLFKKVQSEMKPDEKPDEITDSGDAGGDMGDFNKKLKDGNANEVDLGDFILNNS